jgi:hypothetical protein
VSPVSSPDRVRIDHLQTAKNALGATGTDNVLEYMTQMAQAHALVSIAESLKVLADMARFREGS